MHLPVHECPHTAGRQIQDHHNKGLAANPFWIGLPQDEAVAAWNTL
jgi:hypothetical protein